MKLEDLRSILPDYAKDLRLNLDSVLGTGAPGLDAKQIAAIALASGVASGHKPFTQALEADAAEHLSAEEINGAKMAAAMMGMNNIYYRFIHLVSDEEYGKMRASLRMNGMMNPGIDKMTFELCSLAVSAINGCGMCMDSHEKTVRKHDVTAQAVQSSVRIASVVHAVAKLLAYEAD